jgi:hypothetical protein
MPLIGAEIVKPLFVWLVSECANPGAGRMGLVAGRSVT